MCEWGRVGGDAAMYREEAMDCVGLAGALKGRHTALLRSCDLTETLSERCPKCTHGVLELQPVHCTPAFDL